METMRNDLFALKGKTALVTGAASGIGQRMALAFALAGADVVMQGRNADKLNRATAEQERETGKAPRRIVADLAEISDWDAFVADHGLKIDILANVAGINLRQPYEAVTLETWDATLDINLKVPFFLARALIPHMRENGWGRIINIGSLQSSRAFPDSIPYGASKGGVVQLTRAMAEAWSRHGIGCNAIAPGFFPTQMTTPIYANPETVARNAAQTAVGRNGELQDLDGVSVFLASRASDYLTGQTLYLDGGFSAK